MAPRTNQKLSFRYYVPFPVIEHVGTVAYKLQLPAECRIHPMVHVSQLKHHVPPSVCIEEDITQILDDLNVLAIPIHFLDSRVCQKGSSAMH